MLREVRGIADQEMGISGEALLELTVEGTLADTRGGDLPTVYSATLP